MASFQSLSAFAPHAQINKITKSRSKTVAVKPILKKFSIQSEKTSLDLDRAWEDQDGQTQTQNRDWRATITSSPSSFLEKSSPSPDRATFNEPSTRKSTSISSSRLYNHARSISGTSHASIATSSNSSNGAQAHQAHRQSGGAFVHPFQQTPRTSSPPVSYANSLASIADACDHSPTITEDDDIEEEEESDPSHSHNSLHIHQDSNQQPSHSNHHHKQTPTNKPHSLSQPSLLLRRPSLANHRTSSNTDISSPRPPLRVNTTRTISSTTRSKSSRLSNVANRPDLDLDRSLDSPASINFTPTSVASPATPVAMSPLRSSFDASSFPRLRAKSDLDTATRAEHLRVARRKFELRERAKEEKYAREEIKRRERADNKRAQELEKQAAAMHKEQMAVKARQDAAELEEAMSRGKPKRKTSMTSSGRPSMSFSRPSLSLSRPSLSLVRPSTPRKSTATPLGEPEKFASSNYECLDAQSPPAFGTEAGGARRVNFHNVKRRNTAKRKTQSSWTEFILWLRTKLLRMGRDR
ncbi:hypothetical protein F4810DRAFT_706706 [Camillea tinctor]|nr:hypothetical protein F4810DRAFT_706706 [Camillea tinctor]